MNLNASSNTITKVSGDSSFYSCDWTFSVSCLCDNCILDRILRSPNIADPDTSINCCLQIQLGNPIVFKICDSNTDFENYKLQLRIRNRNGVYCYDREYSNVGAFLTKNVLNAQNQIENEYSFVFLNVSDIKNCNYLYGQVTMGVTIIKPEQLDVAAALRIPRKVLANQSDAPDIKKKRKISDVTFIIGKQKFYAHRSVLESCSPVFRAMFAKEVDKTTEKIIVIDDISEQGAAQVLNYMYNKVIDKDVFKDLAFDILPFTHKYEVQGLMEACEESLSTSLDNNNAFKFLLTADVYRMDLLKKAAVRYITGNAKDVVETEDFKKFVATTKQNWLKDIFLAFG